MGQSIEDRWLRLKPIKVGRACISETELGS